VRSSLRLEAPSGTPVDQWDKDFCHSHFFQGSVHDAFGVGNYGICH
jgi:hypothetical protein